MSENNKPVRRAKLHWIALFWLGVIMTVVSGFLFVAGLPPLLDGADDPARGTTGQMLILTAFVLLVVGPVTAIVASIFG